jgi:hypothetical protein
MAAGIRVGAHCIQLWVVWALYYTAKPNTHKKQNTHKGNKHNTHTNNKLQINAHAL